MIKSKINLHFNKIVIIILFISIVNCCYNIIIKKPTTEYQANIREIIGYINEIKTDGNKITIELIGKEKIIVNYYVNTYNEYLKAIKEYEVGYYLKVQGDLVVPSPNTTFNLFNYQKFLLSNKIYWLFNADKIELVSKNRNLGYEIKNFLIERIEKIKSNKEYLYAFILGDSSYLEDNIINSYRDNGITHLFAISGMQIMILAAIILKVGQKIIHNEKVLFVIIMIFLILYAFITNFSPSIMRAIILYAGLTVNRLYSLKISKISLFLMIFSLFLLYNPYFVYNLGFLFSFIICFYLILFQKAINNYQNPLLKLIITSTIAFLASFPIVIDNFYEINLLSPLLNLIFIPLVTFLIFPLSIITILCPIINPFFSIVLTLFERLSLLFSKIDFTHLILAKPSLIILIIYYILITIILYGVLRKRYWYISLLIISILIHTNISFFYSYPSITFIDVGQGDSTLIILPHNKGNILIDTGGIINYSKEEWMQKKKSYHTSTDTIIPYLKSLGIKKIDYLVLTHGDFDHVGEANNLINSFEINNVIFNSGHNNNIEEEIINNLNKKRISYKFFNQNMLSINKYQFKFLNTKNTKDENKDSLIILTNLNGWNILLMGDATKSEEIKLSNGYLNTKMDILKVGHHGSNTSTDSSFIEKIKPQWSVISAGRNNRFHHPHESTIDTLNKYNIKTYVTGVNGSIKMIFKKELAIYTCL